MVVGTFYDIVFIQFPKWQSDKKETTISGESVVEADEKMPLVQKEGNKKKETGKYDYFGTFYQLKIIRFGKVLLYLYRFIRRSIP